ncbi:MAG: hypothetical protein H6Q41_3928 [Deltaproteobacteria bacterium]|nr:hypothetical protein [Deltaproteobacteria bacterium]
MIFIRKMSVNIRRAHSKKFNPKFTIIPKSDKAKSIIKAVADKTNES